MQVLIVVNFDTEEVSVQEMGPLTITEALQKTPDNGSCYIFEVDENTLKEFKTLDFDSMSSRIDSIPFEQKITSMCNIEME